MLNQVFLPWKNTHAATSFPKIKGDSLLTAHENIRPILTVKSFAYPSDLLSFYSSYFWLWPIQSEKWGWWCWLKRREGIRICCSGWSKGAEIVSNVEQFFFMLSLASLSLYLTRLSQEVSFCSWASTNKIIPPQGVEESTKEHRGATL